MFVFSSPSSTSRRKIIAQRALDRVGETKYCPVTYNCEHFAADCTHERAESRQVSGPGGCATARYSSCASQCADADSGSQVQAILGAVAATTAVVVNLSMKMATVRSYPPPTHLCTLSQHPLPQKHPTISAFG